MQEVDQRIRQATDYLAVTERRDVLHMAPSALLREAAESRRQLAAVLAAYADLQARWAPHDSTDPQEFRRP